MPSSDFCPRCEAFLKEFCRCENCDEKYCPNCIEEHEPQCEEAMQ